MRFLTHFLVGAACFWLGVAHEMARRPPPIVYRTVVNPIPAGETATCKAAKRLCKLQDQGKKL